MKRTGECSQCGTCCNTLKITAILSNAIKQHRNLEEVTLYYSYRNISVVGINQEKDSLFLEIPLSCSQLDSSNRCKVHDRAELKPLLCQLYPTYQDNILKCGYQFVDSSLV